MEKTIKNRRIEWVFFDVGDVLVNEDRLRCNLFKGLEKHLHAGAIDLSFQDMLSCREGLILGEDDESPHYTIAKRYLPVRAYRRWHRELKHYIHRHLTRDLIVIPGMDRLVRTLSKTYSLGLIADQPPEILDFLKRKGLLEYFKVRAISGLLNISKPSKRIFEWAVDRAGCRFSKCVVIGDRIDRDIVPAKRLNMRTIHVRWNTYRKGFAAKTRKERLYLRSLDRVKNWPKEPSGRAEEPDAFCERVSELSGTIHKLR